MPFTVFTAYVIPNLLFLSTDLPSLNISYEERHTTRGLLSLASSPENNVFEVRPHTARVCFDGDALHPSPLPLARTQVTWPNPTARGAGKGSPRAPRKAAYGK